MKIQITFYVSLLLPFCMHAMESKQPHTIMRYKPNAITVHGPYHNLTVNMQSFNPEPFSNQINNSLENANASIQIEHPGKNQSNPPIPLPLILPVISYYALLNAKKEPLDKTTILTWGTGGFISGAIVGSCSKGAGTCAILGGLFGGILGHESETQRIAKNYDKLIQNIVATNKALFTKEAEGFPIADVHVSLEPQGSAGTTIAFNNNNISILNHTPFSIATSTPMLDAFKQDQEKVLAWQKIRNFILMAHAKQIRLAQGSPAGDG